MEIFNSTGVLKSGTLRVTKSIGALVVKSSRKISELTTEKISIHIERSNGDNDVIANNILLKAFIATSLFGEGKAIDTVGGLVAMCDIAEEGYEPLQENERIVITLTDLLSAQTYALNGIEMPFKAVAGINFSEKVMLAGEKVRKFDINAFDEAYIVGDFTKLRLTYDTDQGDRTCEYTKDEVRAIASEMGLIGAGALTQLTDTLVNLVLAHEIEIHAENQVNIILRDVDKTEA